VATGIFATIVKKSGVERRESHGRRTVAEQTSFSHTLIADPRLLDALPVDENNPKEKSITELEYKTWRTPGIQKAVQHGPCSRCYHLLPICRVAC
jgi:hypothetical protein